MNFESHVVKNDGCWDWNGAIDDQGYARLSSSSKLGTVKGHRASYIIYKGKIPNGKMVRHLCHKSSCTNPDHLEIGTNQDNMNDMLKAKRQSKGSKHPSSKLKEIQVQAIKKQLNLGSSGVELSKKYKVSHTAIYDIKNEKWWKHV